MRKLVAAVVLSVLVVAPLFAGESTPVKLSLVPGVSVPLNQDVVGLDWGLLALKTPKTVGLQWSPFASSSSEEMTGWQASLVNHADKLTGIQDGWFNFAKDVTGLQLGLVNVTKRLYGVQLGIINVAGNGFLPVCVVLNAAF